MKDYLDYLNEFNNTSIIEIKEYASKNRVPIICDEGLSFLTLIVKLVKPTNILEIGTAIGYSSIMMALSYDEAFIDTIERDKKMYDEAIKNVAKFNLASKINIYFADALEININELKEEYDIIFIDAAKAQYQNFFEKFTPLLKVGGIVISDNILFRGLVGKNEKLENKNHQALVKKIENYNDYLKTNDYYDTSFYDIGDGMAVSIKVRE